MVVAVLAGVIGLYRFQENWAEYRTMAEALKREKFLYLAKADPYGGDKAFELLVAQVEGLLKSETGNWTASMRKSIEADRAERAARDD